MTCLWVSVGLSQCQTSRQQLIMAVFSSQALLFILIFTNSETCACGQLLDPPLFVLFQPANLKFLHLQPAEGIGFFPLSQSYYFRFIHPYPPYTETVCSFPESGPVIWYVPQGTMRRAFGIRNVPRHLGCIVIVPTHCPLPRRMWTRPGTMLRLETLYSLTRCPCSVNDTLSQVPTDLSRFSKSYCWLQIIGQFNTGQIRLSWPPGYPG